MRYRGWLIGGIVGMLVGTGGLAAAQSLLGTTTLVVNGQAYHGAFTPLESSTTLYVPLPQLANAMGFSYTWAKNQLSIETAGYTPPASSSNYPLQLHTGVSVSTATTVLPANFQGVAPVLGGRVILKAFTNSGHYTAASIGFTYQRVRRNRPTNRLLLLLLAYPQRTIEWVYTITGMVGSKCPRPTIPTTSPPTTLPSPTSLG